MRFLDHKLVQVGIIGILSLAFAVILFRVTGSLAEANGKIGALGISSIKTSGGLAGFIIVYWLLSRQFERLAIAKSGRRRLKVTLRFEGRPLPRHAGGLRAHYKVHYRETQNEEKFPCAPRWEAGGLTIDIPVDNEENALAIVLETDAVGTWETEYFYPLSHNELVRRMR
jgi:hypothetical protein